MTPKQILQQDAFDVLKKDLDESNPTYRQEKAALATRCSRMTVGECKRIINAAKVSA